VFKPNLLLLHGALGTRDQLQAIQNHLSKHYAVYSFNFEGHGDAFSENEFSIKRFTQNLKEFISTKNLENVAVFGYSMGGYVALNYAVENSKKLAKVITLGTKFNWTNAFAEQEVKKLNPDAIEVKVPKFADYLKKIHSESSWKQVVAKTARMMKNLGNAPALTSAKLNTISIPVLITLGELDHMISLQESENMVAQLKTARLKVFKDFVHPIERIDAKRMADEIDRFIRS